MQFSKTEKKPVFTIITVCYNSEKTIERTIRSVLNQTFRDYEYWIIDGGSTDDTLNIISSYIDKFENRLYVISEPDTGIYNAMNKGIRLAKGKIIGLVNSDDWLDSQALSFISESAANHMLTKRIYCGWVRFHYENGKVSILRTNKKRHEQCLKNIDIGVRHPATFVGREVYNKIGGFDEQFKVMADADFIIRCAKSGISFVFLNKILANMSDGGISNNVWNNINVFRSEIKKLCLKHVKQKNKYYWAVTKKFIRLYLKIMMPRCILRLYRRIC